jgi:hypothetical protein
MTAVADTRLKLPTKLADLDLKLLKALNTPVVHTWPEEEKFLDAACPEAVAKVMIHSSDLHARLASAKIAHLFRPEIVTAGRAKGGVASKVGGRVAYLTDLTFIIEYSHKVWLQLTPEQRIALVDHGLAHCERDPETGAWTLRDHDVEEFSEIVGRWGLWTPSLRGFGMAIDSAQTELFVPMGQDEPDDQADAERQRIKRGGK